MSSIDMQLEKLSSADIERLQRLARAKGIKKRDQVRVPISKAPRNKPLPLSYSQQAMWLLTQSNLVSAAYHIPVALRLRGYLDHAAFKTSLDALVARHEALRSVFTVSDEGPQVEILPASVGVKWIEHDLRGNSNAWEELDQISRHEAHEPFDLSTGPLIRARLVRLDEREYVFLITQHHIVTDAWSIGVFARELAALYCAFREQRPSPLVDLKIQYQDYAVWQREWLVGERLEQLCEYWREILANAPTFLDLPTDHPRKAVQDFGGGYLPILIESALAKSLKQLSERHGVTLFMTLLAAWGAVLSRLSRQDDVIVGTPSANRGHQETEGLIGLFINTLPLRINLSNDPTVAELLARVRAMTVTAQEHQDLPFERIVEIVQPERSLQHSPLFQVLFDWESDARGVLELPEISTEPLRPNYGVARFDLRLGLDEAGDTIVGGITYATSLFDEDTARRHIEYLLNMLVGMVSNADQVVSDIPLLNAEEQHLVLEEWNATDAKFPTELCIHELFEEQVRKTPDAVAVVCGDESISYAGLNVEANCLAHHLIALGVKPDDRVAICVDRSPEMVIGLLGILKAGAAYVPLDPSYPSERLSHVLVDAAPKVLLCDASGKALFGDDVLSALTVLQLDQTSWSEHSAANPDARALGLTSRHLAYVIYTSGSTGIPKGVMVEHRSVTNFYFAMMESIYEPAESSFRVGWNASFSFDMSIKGFSQLLSGHCLVIIPQQVRVSGEELNAFLEREAIDAFDTTPSQLRSMMDEGFLNQGSGRLQRVLIGGESVDADAWNRLAKCSWLKPYNMYGPTECTVDATIGLVSTENEMPHIGKGIPNARIYLLDDRLQLVPLGAIGELYIGGAGVARGYLNRPDLTAERFLADPFAKRPGTRMYKTGDLARYLSDGNLEFVGRNDDQVKIRGFRIELGEIEARLVEHPEVRQAVVVAREDEPGEKRLVAYYTTGESLGSERLHSHLSERLPEYMVPTAFVQIEELPLTSNGKLDRSALPAPEHDALVRQTYEPPQGEMEEALAIFWQELLHIERIGRNDSFFDLGGHSLLAVRLLVQIRQVLGIELPIATIFAKRTLSEMAGTIGRLKAETNPGIFPPIVRVSRNNPLPLSFAQQRLWFLAQIEDVSVTYHIPAALRLMGRLDRDALEKALNALMSRHEALRSIFIVEDGEPHIGLLPEDTSLPLTGYDLREEPRARERLVQLNKQEVVAPFDLTKGPLVRAALIRLADEEYVFLLTQHHIVSDGWSMGIFARELSTLYGAFSRGEVNPLPQLEIQYPDYAAWQRKWLSGERLEKQSSYWRETLAGAPTLLELPIDRPRPTQQSFDGGYVPVTIDSELTQGLKQLAAQHETTLFMILLAAWAAVLSRLSGQNDVVIGTPSANRGRSETEALIGFFVSTLALRIDLTGEPTVSELLSRVRATTLAAQDHQDLPFEQIVEIVQPPRNLSHTPVFQTLFAWDSDERNLPEFPGIRSEVAFADYHAAKYDLRLDLHPIGETLIGGMNYATSLFAETTIERHIGYLLKMLEGIVANADQAVSEIPLLTQEERHLVLEGWNATGADYASELCIQELFEEQANNAPDAIAVVCGNEALSYAELNAQANRLAHHLIGLGVRPNDRVAICVERSVNMVVGLLAILKAGGAYVPLDPAYPSERLSSVLMDAAPAALLCDATGRSGLAEHVLSSLTVLQVDQPGLPWDALPTVNPDARDLGLTSRHLAYVIYTSGSTGIPKGVMGFHQPVITLIDWITKQFHVGSRDVLLFTTSLSFDLSVYDIFGLLASGGCIRIASQEELLNPERLAQILLKEVVTFWDSAPAVFHQLLPFLNRADSLRRIPSLRLAFFSGDWVPLELFPVIHQQFPACQMIALGGATEATVWSNFFPVSHIDRNWVSIPYGRPIQNARYYILDRFFNPVPIGARGDLYIGGHCLSYGYLNRADLTAERFIADPFSPEEGARMYRTGDLARFLPDGNIEFLGRNDDQVKIRGFRIELGEIETRLAEHPQVRQAVVVTREDNPGEKRLIAYVVPTGEDRTTLAADLRAHLTTRLPEYMVPSAFVQMKDLPLTSNGKIDRRALPVPEQDAYVHHAYEPPQGEMEEILAAIWQQLLHLDQVGRNDNFFELGGHSLLTVQMIERLRRFDLQLEIRTLFSTPVLRELAAALKPHSKMRVPANLIEDGSTTITPEMLPLIDLTQEEIDRIVSRVPGGVSNIQDIYSLTPLQDGILFHHLLASGGDPYLLIRQLGFPNRDLLDRFLTSVQQLIDRHDILRTAFMWEALSRPAQVVLRKANMVVTELELDPKNGPVVDQLYERFDPRTHRIDLSLAPLLQHVIAYDVQHDRWVLLQRLHHLIGDHASLDALLTEIEAFLAHEEHKLVPSMPFRNVVAEARLIDSPKDHEAFFRKMLGDISEPTLPFGLTDVYQDGRNISESRRMLPQELNNRLRAQARKLAVSLASLCHLAWGQVVARSSNSEHVVFGTVLSGRMQAGSSADRAVGLFVNTLPFRMDLDGASTAKAAQDAHATLAELLVHEHASLALAQRCSGVGTSGPLFSAILNYRHNSKRDVVPGPIEETHPLAGVESLFTEERTNYPLTLSVEDYGSSLGVMVEVVNSLSPERICGYMEQALESLATALESAPETAISSLEVMPPEERHLQLEVWNATEGKFNLESCIHELFEEQVHRTPEAVAVVWGDEALSYAELNIRANRLARHLIGMGVCLDDRVAICVERGLAMVIGMLAIFKAGGVYLPLDVSYPRERLAYILSDATPGILICDEQGRDAVGSGAVAEVKLLDVDAWMNRSDSPNSNIDPTEIGLTASRFAYVMYTSGSTGAPKGVMVRHRTVSNQLIAIIKSYDFRSTDRVLQFGSPSSDGSLEEIFGALLTGATLILRTDSWLASVNEFDKLCTRHDITAMSIPAAFWAKLTSAWSETSIPNTLREIVIGYEAVNTHSLALWFDHTSPKPLLLNSYGPTEATINATTQLIEPHSTRTSIGRPMVNNRIYILDANVEPIPIGAVGEIYIGGAGVTDGYLLRTELTAERFVPDPFSSEDGARMYRTGDLARYLSDGQIEFLGRNDYQVKVRGFRIELGEIEARLAEHPLLRQATVIAREDIPGDKRLVAYVVTAPDADTGNLVGDLRSHLISSLPEYMVPSAFVQMREFPLTPNGKLDRKALPAPDRDAFALRAYEAPEGHTEVRLAELWRQLLSVEHVGRHDHFFELGGHSLLAVQLVGRVYQEFNAELTIATLFAQPTLSRLASEIDGIAIGTELRCHPALIRLSPDETLPLSYSQQRLWFLGQFADVSTGYHIPTALRLHGQLDPSMLGQSLDVVFGRHDALRSIFISVDGEPCVRLLPKEMGLPLEEYDLRNEADQIEQLSSLSRRISRAPFDLAQGPLVRAALIRLADEEYVFLLTQHHIVSDGWSMGIFARELSTLYGAFIRGEVNPLPQLEIQYPDYAAWQRKWLSGERLEKQSSYWRETLAGAPTLLELPIDRPRPTQQSFDGGYVPVTIDSELTQGLKQLAAQHETTLFMILLAAWAAVLSRLSGQNDVVIGTPSANRGRSETEALIGFFVSTLALRIDLTGEPTVSELLSRVRATTLAAQDHQDLPFEQIVEIVQPPRNLSHTPVFQVMLSWQNNQWDLPEFYGMEVSVAETVHDLARFDQELMLFERGGGITGGILYATSLFDDATIVRHIGYLLNTLKGMVSNPGQFVSSMPLLDAEEQHIVLEEWNATEGEYDEELCIHEVFEKQVDETPDAIAVVCGDEALSYAELNARANRLAHHLIELGVSPDDRVGICAERSLEMVIGLLAILKAGGAYVPLDPAYPSERLTQMLNDADPRIVLCDTTGEQAFVAQAAMIPESLILDKEQPSWLRRQEHNPHVLGITSRHLAYVIYTSGSTGMPKGVMNEHRALVNRLTWMQKAYGLDSKDVVLQKTSFGFDVSAWEFFWTLLQGATLVVPPPDAHKDPLQLIELIRRWGVTTIHFVPSMLAAFLDSEGVEGCTSLRRLICSGEALSPLLARDSGRKLPAAQLYNLYGPTEAAIDVTAWTCPQSFDGEIVPIGRPIMNLRIYLLDHRQQPAPLGAVGELYIGGVGVARGYLNRPGLTAERFLADPFSPGDGARMYRTGDLARYLPDGNIEFLGRNDDQVKIRGFRIELGEIDARLAEHPEVRQAVVIPREDHPGRARLVAYYIGSASLSAEELRSYLSARLPEYMVPAAFVLMDELPLTPNGKLDRKALPAPEYDAYVSHTYAPPDGEMEEALAAIWQELLHVDQVGRNDNFFELGGHSLLAVQLIERLRQSNLHVDIRSLFSNPVLSEMAVSLNAIEEIRL